MDAPQIRLKSRPLCAIQMFVLYFALHCIVDFVCLHWPSFERGDSEERQHGLTDIIKVEFAVSPLTYTHYRCSIHVHQILASIPQQITPLGLVYFVKSRSLMNNNSYILSVFYW